MKKIFTYVALLALCGTANAASVKTLSLGIETPGVDELSLMGVDISADGRYVCGILEMGMGIFVGDWRAEKIVFAVSEDEDAELRHVNNNGVGIGYDGDNGVTFSIDEVEAIIECPEGYKYVLGEDISNDGSVKVGSLIGTKYIDYGAYCKNDGGWQLLPMDFAEGVNIGDYAEEGSYAKYVSGDGKVILGQLGNFGPATLWRLNDEGKYVPDFIGEEYVIVSDETMDKPYAGFYPLALSDNGKYALIRVTENSDAPSSYPAVYNTETDELTVFNEEQAIDEMGLGLFPTAICDDGSFVGIVGKPMFGDFGAFIMKAGTTQAEMFVSAYPDCAEYFGLLDYVGYHMPVGMSADGRYILGYGYVYDFDNEDAEPFFQTYVLDTTDGGVTGIEAVEAVSGDAVPVEYFTIDGRRNSGASKGLNIVRMSDGSVRKVVK